jgi:hypothetical protein
MTSVVCSTESPCRPRRKHERVLWIVDLIQPNAVWLQTESQLSHVVMLEEWELQRRFAHSTMYARPLRVVPDPLGARSCDVASRRQRPSVQHPDFVLGLSSSTQRGRPRRYGAELGVGSGKCHARRWAPGGSMRLS